MDPTESFSIVVSTKWTLWIFLELVEILFLGKCIVIEKDRRGRVASE